MDDIGIIARYRGVLVRDRWASHLAAIRIALNGNAASFVKPPPHTSPDLPIQTAPSEQLRLDIV